MLAIDRHNASMSHLQIRIERHGDDRKLAADIKLSMNVHGTVLDDLERGLHESLFRKPGSGEQQDLIDPASLTAVKFPHIQPLVLSHKFTGYEASIGFGDEEDVELFLADVEIKKITVQPLEGGSVEMTLTASANIDSDDVAELAILLVAENVALTLTPPKAAAQIDPDAANDDGSESEADAA
jgi:hypothetical protein